MEDGAAATATQSAGDAATALHQSALPPLTHPERALRMTSFHSWYPLFRKISPKATVLDVDELQPDFLEWLEEDGLTLPEGSEDAPPAASTSIDNLDSDSEDSDGAQEVRDSDSEDQEQPRRFIALDQRIRQVIEKYDGRVFPKLNWSAPRDAAWILPGSNLQCTSPGDVYLLLKSSDFVGNDVAQARELELGGASAASGPAQSSDSGASQNRPKLYLVLKKWFDMPSFAEFRCFVRAGRFVAASQRDDSFYEHLQSGAERRRIVTALHEFWKQQVRQKVAPADPPTAGSSADTAPPSDGPQMPELAVPVSQQTLGLDDYIFDAYITRDASKVFLVDLNPYLPRTDALLWDWDELEDLASGRGVKAAESGDKTSSAAERGDEPDDGESSSDEADDSDESDGHETVLRVYTDGSRPPQTIRRELSAAERAERRRPILRIITSHAHAQQHYGNGAAPKYAHNMMPHDVVDAGDGQSIAQFAKEWNDRLGKAMRDD